jgi:hypothetical protein
MKKILLSLAIIATLGAKAQIDTTGLTTKIVDKFKAEYVKEHFKDPYSFQLLGVKYWVITKGKDLETKIISDSISLAAWKGKKFMKNEYQQAESNIEVNRKLLAELPESEKNTLFRYGVSIECRGANSYGGLVYSQKIGYYYPATHILEIL